MHSIKKGSVLVVGGGIAGMQAALDCAEAGFKVYLLEKDPAIGGNMARLDKTFPTNDCAMCMISPKLVETGRHLNIKIISYSDLEKIEGEPGNFTVTIKRRARFVDEEKCNGCGDCETACPVTLPDTFNGSLSKRKAIFRLYPQAIPNVYTIEKAAAAPPCRGTCPAGVNAQGYIALIAQEKFLEALDVVRERMPFAGICGRICHHPCETQCNRAEIDEPVAVRHLKRFVADYEKELLEDGRSIEREAHEPVSNKKGTGEIIKPVSSKKGTGEKIAIIGAGPAGLTCADSLVESGHKVTVFEKEEKTGGMMRFGIPAYRLPRDFMDHEIQLLLDKGIELKTGATFGEDFTLQDLKAQGYASIFIATGAGLARPLELEGVDEPDSSTHGMGPANETGLLYGIPFLRDVNTGVEPEVGKRVVVIGGGNVAVDVARCALRLPGVENVALYCLENRQEMPAHDWEIDEAVEEGVDIQPSWGPKRVFSEKGRFKAIQLKYCLSVFDEEKRFSPRFDEARQQRVEADTVILAIGQLCDVSFYPVEMKLKRDLLAVNEESLETSVPGVFAGGDNVLGPSSLVQAVAQGHRAAESIHNYLRGSHILNPSETAVHTNAFGSAEPFSRKGFCPPEAQFAEIPSFADRNIMLRTAMPAADASQRRESFEPIELGFDRQTAVYEAQRCLQCGICSQCLQCVKVCKADAIDHSMVDRNETYQVGAVILTGGYDLFDVKQKAEYGWERFANVVTSMQFERILSASGPYKGKLKRLSDGKEPVKIAWIQCVGSRDVTIGKGYCSSVCCMAATKEAIVAKEHEPQVQATIFYIDIRTFGKGYESFLERAVNDYGVRYVRSQISSIKENPFNRNLLLKYVDHDKQMAVMEEEFDMVVLSVGIAGCASAERLAGITRVATDVFGFLAPASYNQLLTHRQGIFLGGAVSGPRDIPDTVMQSSAAAALCGEFLHNTRYTEALPKTYPEERDVAGEAPKVGVFICHCGINISSVVNVEALALYLSGIPNVVHAENLLYTCSQDSQQKIKQLIIEKQLNRVVVASCTPRTHESLFHETLREAGLNKYLFEMVNIREQCSWVHRDAPTEATGKARTLVRGGIGKSEMLEPLVLKDVPVTKAALVLGGGMSGLTAALSLARQGFGVFLVEKTGQLGGNLRHIAKSPEGYDWQKVLESALGDVTDHPLIQVFLNSEPDTASGHIGNFSTTLKGDSQTTLEHGVTIVAVGAQEYRPEVFLFGEQKQVITQRQLEKLLGENTETGTVVMVQCVGSRMKEHPYCSRVCCGAAIKNAITIKKRSPGTKVYILYRDINTYGFKETIYREARELGVMFIHFPDNQYPEVRTIENAGLSLNVFDTVLGEELTLEPDLLVLSTAVEPGLGNNERLSELFKLSLGNDGFFMEAHIKLRPVDFANEGHYVCGLAHSPKYTEENITQALAASGRAATVLAKDYLTVGGVVSVVESEKCAVCLTCVRECVFNAPHINAEGKAEIEAAKCRGCGNCASACPAKAIQLKTFSDAQQRALFSTILKECRAVNEEARN
ncbi:MAG: FAD-dependent oxidoreductase [bacterium]|nr:FAD-dependent oxidoreductase [bacterium]